MSQRFVPKGGGGSDERDDSDVPVARLEREFSMLPIADVDDLMRALEGQQIQVLPGPAVSVRDVFGRAQLETSGEPPVPVTGRQGHTTPLSAVTSCYLPDGRTVLVSASEGGTIRLWDARTQAALRVAVPGDATRAVVAFAGPGGWPWIASGGDDGKVRYWDPYLEPRARLGQVVTRGLSDRAAEVDLLGRGEFTRALGDTLRKPGTTEDSGPAVITVEGPWGSGKSTVLNLVAGQFGRPVFIPPKLRKLTVAAADALLRSNTPPPELPAAQPEWIEAAGEIVVTFNPWQYQSSDQVWAGLARAITQAAERVLVPTALRRERYWFGYNVIRVDRRHLQRELWKRILSPFLKVGVLGLGLSVVSQLAKWPVPLPVLLAISVAPLAFGLLHTAARYLFARASAFLPGELFAGPVAFAGSTPDPVVRDPYYQARSGYLYLVQHDVRAVLKDLEARGHQLIVLIDDLDRCTPRTTAEVFEAINVFLSGAMPRARFVLGLDPTVVASHVDHAYRELADARVVTHPDDPSPGWTFLRKLVQLPIRLPLTTEDSIGRLLDGQLGPVDQPHTTGIARPRRREPRVGEPQVGEPTTVAAPPKSVDEVVIAIERDSKVREELHRRLAAQPEHSVREEKRLINVWQFYLRVLASSDAEQACHLVSVAEVVTRWPAYQHLLRGHWRELAEVVDDDVAWGALVAKIGFRREDERAAKNIRALLQDCDAEAVAALADRLL
ncbi:hypothetical protein Lesp02_62210 [Lentzea sp. NBRC 105346]|uniref:P-loop NTPase fold protein n=1 Tax=Lentzea sp. NBRC 105346 TaxID=3032205 RepID=UPI002556DA8A|nr:P-loop NTPase fold protein [Lentzea sp. NBRC 105346]GLZ34034.1 hypothetical protein Lesp02_62210 [Lentzea sp. NBRC 105346]